MIAPSHSPKPPWTSLSSARKLHTTSPLSRTWHPNAATTPAYPPHTPRFFFISQYPCSANYLALHVLHFHPHSFYFLLVLFLFSFSTFPYTSSHTPPHLKHDWLTLSLLCPRTPTRRLSRTLLLRVQPLLRFFVFFYQSISFFLLYGIFYISNVMFAWSTYLNHVTTVSLLRKWLNLKMRVSKCMKWYQGECVWLLFWIEWWSIGGIDGGGGENMLCGREQSIKKKEVKLAVERTLDIWKRY